MWILRYQVRRGTGWSGPPQSASTSRSLPSYALANHVLQTARFLALKVLSYGYVCGTEVLVRLCVSVPRVSFCSDASTDFQVGRYQGFVRDDHTPEWVSLHPKPLT
eukprot:2223502-Rhodomonas_salina.1